MERSDGIAVKRVLHIGRYHSLQDLLDIPSNYGQLQATISWRLTPTHFLHCGYGLSATIEMTLS